MERLDVTCFFLWDGLCYAKFFLYTIGNKEICRIFSVKVLNYGDMQKNFCLIIVSCHAAVRRICLPLVSGEEKSMLSENQRKIFADFHESVEAEGILDKKTSHMIKVAAAMAFGCYP